MSLLLWKNQKAKYEVFSIFMIDIDHFKWYNDTYGHVSGDECLKKVALTLHNEAFKVSGLASRYGGEEFAIIAPLDAVAAAHFAERLVSKISDLHIPHSTSQTAPYVTISCGVVTSKLHEEHEPNLQFLIHTADAALYQAKNSGRNRFCTAL